MKTKTTFFSLMTFVLAIGVTSANAQGRGNERAREDDRADRQYENEDTHYRRDRAERRNRHEDYSPYARRGDRHQHDRYCNHQTVVNHHHSMRPRYVYYRDYDTYYDYQNSVYIFFSGRGWTVSRFAPVSMRYVDVRHARRYEVNYPDDDFAGYLGRRGRPQHGRECDW